LPPLAPDNTVTYNIVAHENKAARRVPWGTVIQTDEPATAPERDRPHAPIIVNLDDAVIFSAAPQSIPAAKIHQKLMSSIPGTVQPRGHSGMVRSPPVTSVSTVIYPA
jgi:hypothetical protein